MTDEELSGTAGLISWDTNSQSDANLLRQTKRYILLRQKRRAVLGRSLGFDEPDWDILLGLFAAQLENRHLSLDETCRLTEAIREQTAVRLLRAFAQNGLIQRFEESTDAVGCQIRLTPRATQQLEQIIGYENRGDSMSLSIDESA